MSLPPKNLRITEIFYSLQGETRTVGLPTVFVRLTGCPLRCQYCDTAYAFSGGQKRSIKEVLSEVATLFGSGSSSAGRRYVTVTGGEPLAQPACLPLLTALCDQGYCVSIETSGALDVSDIDPRVIKVMDIKTPGSGEVARNRYDNIAQLSAHDQLKFVLCDRADYDWAKQLIETHALLSRCEILFSPSYEQLTLPTLADWIVSDRLPIRLQCQLHKLIWGDRAGC